MFGSVNLPQSVGKGRLDIHAAENASEAEEGTPLMKTHAHEVSRVSDAGPFAKGSILSTAVLLIKNSIGAGVLAMPAHAAEVGLRFMLISLTVGAVLVFLSLRMITEASLTTERWCFEDICESLFHPAFAHITGLMQALTCLGSCVAYLVVGGQIFQVLSGVSNSARQYFVLIVGISVCVPLSVGRDISFLRHLSVVSVSALMLLLMAVAYILIEHGPDKSITSSTLWNGKGDASIFTYMNCISIVTFAYSVQSNMPQLSSEVPDRDKARSKVSTSITISTIFVFIFYSLAAVAGLLAFGIAENQLDTLILDLQPHRQDVLVVLAMIAVISSVTMCFLLNIYPIRQFLGYQIRLLLGHGANHDEELERKIFGMPETRFYDMWSAVGSVLLAVFLAVALESLRTWLELVGAFACSYLAFIVPAMWILRIRSKQTGFHWLAPEIIFCMMFFCGGVFMSAFGTYAALAS